MADYASGNISNPAVTTLETIAVIEVSGRERLNVEFAVSGAALTAFTVAYLFAPSGTYQVVADATAEFTTPAANSAVRGASGDLTGAAVGEHWLVLDTMGVHSVRLQGSSGTSSGVAGSWSAA